MQDMYNPPDTTSLDFEKSYFNEIDVNELFWLNENINNNPAFRKANNVGALNTKTQLMENMAPRTIIYQKI